MFHRLLIANALIYCFFCFSPIVFAANSGLPKIAVTDLSYQEKVREYFHEVSAHEKSSYRERSRDHERDSFDTYSSNSRNSVNAKSESSYYESSGTYSYIERGELHKFVSDIKGEMLKSGDYRVFQGKPVAEKNMSTLFDIIKRIKSGDFQGADYVLFGTVSSIEFRDEVTPVQGSDTNSYIFSLELVADFNLINTKTYEIKAAFSAMGEGQETKLISTSRGGRIVPNRGHVISDVSRSLGDDVASQLAEQFNPNGARGMGASRSSTIERSNEKVVVYE
jgi:hypothetical protein